MSSNPAYAGQVKEMKKKLAALIEHYGDDSDLFEKPRKWQDQVRPGTASAAQ